jgi:hypothetical protein
MRAVRNERHVSLASLRAHHVAIKTVLAGALLLVVAACTMQDTPTAPGGTALAAGPAGTAANAQAGHQSGAHDDHGYIDGWFEGDAVQLHYTKSYFCAEPPASDAPTNCELGAPPEVFPRPGPIPVIYAIAAVGGITPDPSTLACGPGTVCLNHPAMIDASRVGGPPNGPAVPHSHIISEHRGGWFQTVNIRVRDLGVWNQIAEAKTLAKVRELQAAPNAGGLGLISQDTPTNIFFFIASFQK